MSPILTLGGFTTENATDVFKIYGNDVQSALDNSTVGDRLYFSHAGAPWIPPSAAGWLIPHSLEIFGQGLTSELDDGFVYYSSGSHKNSTIWTIADGVNRVHFHDFPMYGTAISDTDGTGDAIRISNTTAGNTSISLERVHIYNAGRSAVRTLGAYPVDGFIVKDVLAYGCRGHGMYLYYCNSVNFQSVFALLNRLAGVYFESGGNGQVQISAASNGSGNASATLDGQVVMKGMSTYNISGGDVEEFVSGTVKNGLVMLGCRGCVVGANEFDNATSSAGSRGIYLRDGCIGNTILSNNFAKVAKAIEIDSASADYGNNVLAQSYSAVDANGAGTVVVPSGGRNFVVVTNLTAGGLADGKVVGVLLGEMTATADIAAGVLQNGLVYFDTNSDKLCVVTGGVGTAVH